MKTIKPVHGKGQFVLFLACTILFMILGACIKNETPADPAASVSTPSGDKGGDIEGDSGDWEIDENINNIENIGVQKEVGQLTLSWQYEEDGNNVERVDISYVDPGDQSVHNKTIDKGIDELKVEIGASSYNKDFNFDLTPIGTNGKKGKAASFTTKLIPILGIGNMEPLVLTEANIDDDVPVRNDDREEYIINSHLLLLSEFGSGKEYDFGDDWNRFETGNADAWPINFDVTLDEGISNFQLWYLPTARGDIPAGMPRIIKIYYSNDGEDWSLFQEVDDGLPFPHPDDARKADRWFSDIYSNESGTPDVKHIRFQVLGIYNKDGSPNESAILFNLTQFGINSGEIGIVDVE